MRKVHKPQGRLCAGARRRQIQFVEKDDLDEKVYGEKREKFTSCFLKLLASVLAMWTLEDARRHRSGHRCLAAEKINELPRSNLRGIEDTSCERFPFRHPG